MYRAMSEFGGFVVCVGFIVCVIHAVDNYFYAVRLEKQEAQREREYARKHGG